MKKRACLLVCATIAIYGAVPANADGPASNGVLEDIAKTLGDLPKRNDLSKMLVLTDPNFVVLNSKSQISCQLTASTVGERSDCHRAARARCEGVGAKLVVMGNYLVENIEPGTTSVVGVTAYPEYFVCGF